MPKVAFFFARATVRLGMGHLTRCRAIAVELVARGVECVMFGPSVNFKLTSDQNLFASWIELTNDGNPFTTRSELDMALARVRPTFAIVDEPGDSRIYDDIFVAHQIDWMQFDGKRQNYVRARWVVNQRPDAKREDYAEVNSNGARKLLLGPSYAPLRREFGRVGERSAKLRHCLAIFGGGDDRGMFQKTIDAFEPYSELYSLTLISGANNPNRAQIQSLVPNSNAIKLLIEPDNVADLFASTDLAVTAGGTTTYELAAAGAPMLVVAVVKNQIVQSRAWDARGACRYAGRGDELTVDDLRRHLAHLIDKPDERQRLGINGRRLCDGRGASRLADVLIGRTCSE